MWIVIAEQLYKCQEIGLLILPILNILTPISSILMLAFSWLQCDKDSD